MANRRMFSKSIIDTDVFLTMPPTTQNLYFHFGISADDDGFVSSPKIILRKLGANEDDLKILIAKNFVIPFESGICVIKDWKIHNNIQKDRYKPTIYQAEMQSLSLRNGMYTTCIQSVSNADTQVRLELGKGKNTSNKLNESVKILPDFEEFWELYPRKEAKKGAFKAFTGALKNNIAPATILNGVKRYGAYIEANKIEQRFIKMPATWLNQDCWNDTYECAKPQSEECPYEYVN